MVLPRLTVLDKRYAIGGVLDASDAFLLSYQAWDLTTEDQIDLREFFPAALIGRADDGLRVQPLGEAEAGLFRYGYTQFLKEAAVLAVLAHPNLERLVDCFEAHGTVYRALEHHAGGSLASVMERQADGLDLHTALTLMMPVLEGLHAAHERGLIHAAVSPRTIFLSKTIGAPVLRCFRTAHLMLARRTGDLDALIEAGVSAPEQYQTDGRPGPWTDLYAWTATLYQVLTGRSLPTAPERQAQDDVPALLHEVPELSDCVADVLERPLALEPARRPRSAQAFLQQLQDALEGKESVPVPASPEASVEAPAPEAPLAADASPEEEETAVDEDAAEQEVVKPVALLAPPSWGSNGPPASEEALSQNEARAPVVSEEEPPSPDAQTGSVTTGEQAVEEAAEDTSTTFEGSLDEEASLVEEAPFFKKVPAFGVPSRSPAPRGWRADRSARPRRRKSLPVLAALAVVVLVAFTGAYVMMQDTGGGLTQYAHFRAQGDSLFEQANYAAAQVEYERALAARPADTYVASRLDEARQRLAEVSEARYTLYLTRGDSLFAVADSLLAAGETLSSLGHYADANKAYYEALKYRPEEPGLLEKGQQASKGMDQALLRNRQQARTAPPATEPDDTALRNRRFKTSRRDGDALFEQGAYQEAREKYNEALIHQPQNEYVRARIAQIDGLLREQTREAQVQRHMDRGNGFMKEGRYAEAGAEFQRVLDLDSSRLEARERLAEAVSQQTTAQHNDRQYQYFRGQGDGLASRGSYTEAVASYRQALSFRPDDAYVQQQIPITEEAARKKEEVLITPQMEEGIYKVVDTPPQLIGGMEALHLKVRYPEKALQTAVTGRVYVQFVVDENGGVRDARVLRGIGAGCDEEALRVIRQAQFEPGKMKGRPVKTLHTLFVTFSKQEG